MSARSPAASKPSTPRRRAHAPRGEGARIRPCHRLGAGAAGDTRLGRFAVAVRHADARDPASPGRERAAVARSPCARADGNARMSITEQLSPDRTASNVAWDLEPLVNGRGTEGVDALL